MKRSWLLGAASAASLVLAVLTVTPDLKGG
jgi:hypothetical protein